MNFEKAGLDIKAGFLHFGYACIKEIYLPNYLILYPA